MSIPTKQTIPVQMSRDDAIAHICNTVAGISEADAAIWLDDAIESGAADLLVAANVAITNLKD